MGINCLGKVKAGYAILLASLSSTLITFRGYAFQLSLRCYVARCLSYSLTSDCISINGFADHRFTWVELIMAVNKVGMEYLPTYQSYVLAILLANLTTYFSICGLVLLLTWYCGWCDCWNVTTISRDVQVDILKQKGDKRGERLFVEIPEKVKYLRTPGWSVTASGPSIERAINLKEQTL